MANLEYALSYIARGWKVFPLHGIDADGKCTCGIVDCGDAGKHPRKELAPRGFKSASGDEAKIREWFGIQAPPSNIGIATGEASDITVLDVDTANGKRGAETWVALIAEKGEPDTLMAKTGSGGSHVYFRYHSGLKTSTNTLGPGIDVRNDGGYVVAPPSAHRSGGVYKWLNDAVPVPLPAHLSVRVETRGRKAKDDPTRRKYTIEQVAEMLAKVPADDRDLWRNVGIILGREFNRSDEAWQAYVAWAATWRGPEGRNHDEIMKEAFYELSQRSAEKELSLGTIVSAAIAGGWVPKGGEVPISALVFYAPGNNFIYRPTVSQWVTEAVNAACTPVNVNGTLMKPSEWLRLNVLATSITKDPTLDGDYIKGKDCRDGVLLDAVGAATFNTYRAPTIESGDARLAAPFLDHLAKVFPRDGDVAQFLDYMAHRVQQPGQKPRFALLIAGEQGVGKDTAVEFCCPAIGHWNVANVEPSDLESSFNEHAASVLVRISEAANHVELTRFAFNERLKVLIAGTPDHIQVNPKYGHKYSVRLHCGVVLTTNHLLTGIYIPQDDRRYDVIQAATRAAMGIADDTARRAYFVELWDWFNDGGATHVAALLRERDIGGFSAANGQRKTSAHGAVVTSGLASDQWIYDALDELGEPDIVRADAIRAVAIKSELIDERKISLLTQPAMLRAGYEPVFDSARKDGRWKLDGKRTTVYLRNGTVLTAAELVARIGQLAVPF